MTTTMTPGVETAARAYVNLRDRASHPAGSFDRKGRFSLAQRYACCAGIRGPSARWPYPEMLHGRTAEHVAHEHGVSAADVRRAARSLDAR